jgi:hypothetical protein
MRTDLPIGDDQNLAAMFDGVYRALPELPDSGGQ